MTDEPELIEVSRLLGDVAYQIGIVAGLVDEMGRTSARRHLLAAHAQIAKARAALTGVGK